MNQKIATLVLSLAIAVGAFAMPSAARAESWCPLNLSDCSAPELAFFSTFSPILLPITSSGMTTLTMGSHRLALAAAAVEDVAVYYDTGRLSGVLPSILQNVKENLADERGVSPDLITDGDAVDRIADAAMQVL